MKIAVLSGKGGTGKTFVSVNMAVTAGQSTYIDCDVEEPNGRLFLHPEGTGSEEVFTGLPSFDSEKCTGCRKCVDFCRFNALVYIKGSPIVFPNVCHSCGGCEIVCPEGAVTEERRRIGIVESGMHEDVHVVTGILDTGEESGVPVINDALRKGLSDKGTVIIDCPPGSACTVMESVAGADFCVLVTEPTAFGFHNFRMVYELVSLLGKPCCAVINKYTGEYEPLERFCREHDIRVEARIPYSRELAAWAADGKIASEKDGAYRDLFGQLLEDISREVCV